MFSCVGVGDLGLHTTLGGLEMVGFLVWAVFVLWFECGECGCATQSSWLLCWGVWVYVWGYVGASVGVSCGYLW